MLPSTPTETTIIGFGYRAENGKDTAVRTIIEAYPQYDIRRYAFGDSLKAEFYDALLSPLNPYWATAKDYFHLPHPSQTFIPDAEKVTWINQHKAALASHLQRYGTEYRRAQDSLYWVNQTRRQIERDKPKFALISDVRFANEYLYVLAFGGYTVKVTRIGYVSPTRDPKHLSETALDGINFHYQIDVPDGQPEELKADAIAVFGMIVEAIQLKAPELEDICVSASAT